MKIQRGEKKKWSDDEKAYQYVSWSSCLQVEDHSVKEATLHCFLSQLSMST